MNDIVREDEQLPASEAKNPDQKAIDDAELKNVKALAMQYATARSFDENARKMYMIDRNYASGKAIQRWASTANLIGSFIDILTSFLYARDPDVTAVAAKNVGGSTKDNASFAETLGIVISRMWKTGRLKKAARKMVRSTLSVGPGWIKVIMTHDTRRDPIVQAQLNDLEDNVARLNKLQEELDDEDNEMEADEIEVQLKDIELTQESLKEKLEVVFRRGLAIDYVQADDMQTSLDVSDIADYLDADWNANELYVLTTELRTMFPRLTKKDVENSEIYYQRKKRVVQMDETEATATEVDMGFTAKETGRFTKESPQDQGDDVTFARVIELWDKRDNHVKTFVIGVGRWGVEPYQPPHATTRFYPYFNLSLFEVDGERHPQSLSSRLMKLQDEYSHKRSSARLHTERSVGGIIFDQTGVKKEDVRKIEAAVAQELIGINPTKGDDIRKLFVEKPVSKIDPLVFSTAAVVTDMERISGVQEALSQSVSTAKTATEAKIQQTGFTSRTSSDRDMLEDLLADLGTYTAELAIQALPAEDVIRIAGEKAFWPEGMDVEDLLTLAEVEIKAGTTGKPDDESLRQSWSVLLPLVTQIMVQIQEAQLTGNLPMALALRNVLEETMRRLDERIDIEKFVPQGLPALPTPDSPNAQAAAAEGAASESESADASAEANRLE